MTVVSTDRDHDALTFTLTADLAAAPVRVWQVWADPRQLERWWGPPTWPATFVEHDLTPGASCRYYMTGPDGEKAHGWWRIVAVDEPSSIEFEDGFADDSGAPNPDLPTMLGRVDLAATDQGTRMTIRTKFASREQMGQVVEMGMEEGMKGAVGQLDALLAA